jgi:AraC family transcriptional regulator
VFRDQHIAVTHSITSAAIPLHAHSEYVFGYYFRGFSRCRVASQPGDVDFGPGDLGLLNPGNAHEDFATDQERDYLNVNIRKELFQDLQNNLCGVRNLPYFGAPKLSHDAELRRICEGLRHEVNHQYFARDILIRSLVTELAVHLLRRARAEHAGTGREEPPSEAHREQVRRASDYLQDNYAREFNLDQIAAVVGLSKYHLERIFKRATGLNLHTYMMLARLDRAKHTLSQTSRPIADIALELGFSDQSHFTNVFKRFVGTTPYAYRLAAR